jgi:iron complex outermembrane receptor protein
LILQNAFFIFYSATILIFVLPRLQEFIISTTEELSYNNLGVNSIMKNTKLSFIYLLLATLISQYIYSADIKMKSDSLETIYYFNPIVKIATKVAGSQRDLAASISLIDEHQLKHSSNSSVFEVVQNHIPDLYVTEWGVMGYGVAGSAAGKISLRGIGGTADTHVMILRNGRPDYMGLMGCTIGDEFITDGIERIEVIRGPSCFLYGTNATGVAINIISKKADLNGFKTNLRSGLGSYNSQKLHISHCGNLGRLGYNITATQRNTEGHREDSNNDYRANHLTAHIEYHVSNNTIIEMNGSFADVFLYDPGPKSAPKNNDWYDIKRWGGDVTFSSFGHLGESYLKIHGNFGHHRFADGWNSDDQMIGFMTYHNIQPFAGNTTTLGFDLKRYGGQGENLTPGINNFPSIPGQQYFITEYAPYLHTQQLFWKRFIASAGMRVEYHEFYKNIFIPKFGLVMHINNASSMRISTSKGFRSPSIRELYFFPNHNEKLRPDEMWNYEIGYNQQLGHRIKIELAVFRSEGENLITLTRKTTGQGFQLTNSGEFENTGIELMFNWLPLQYLEIGTSWSKIDMTKKFPNAPGEKLTAYVTYRIWLLTFCSNLMVIKNWISKDNAKPVPNIYPMKNYALLNFSLLGTIINHIGIKITLKNVLDTHYEAMYGYPMPGRHFIADLSYNF